jgi:hypothetical protein
MTTFLGLLLKSRRPASGPNVSLIQPDATCSRRLRSCQPQGGRRSCWSMAPSTITFHPLPRSLRRRICATQASIFKQRIARERKLERWPASLARGSCRLVSGQGRETGGRLRSDHRRDRKSEDCIRSRSRSFRGSRRYRDRRAVERMACGSGVTERQ